MNASVSLFHELVPHWFPALFFSNPCHSPPRDAGIAGRLLRRVRDFALVANSEQITREIADREQQLTQLDEERGAALERAQHLRDRLDHRPLRGRSVRVIHDPAREADATRVVELLNSLEMDARLFEAEIADPYKVGDRIQTYSIMLKSHSPRKTFPGR